MSQSKLMLFLCVSISLNTFITEGQALPWRFGQSMCPPNVLPLFRLPRSIIREQVWRAHSLHMWQAAWEDRNLIQGQHALSCPASAVQTAWIRPCFEISWDNCKQARTEPFTEWSVGKFSYSDLSSLTIHAEVTNILSQVRFVKLVVVISSASLTWCLFLVVTIFGSFLRSHTQSCYGLQASLGFLGCTSPGDLWSVSITSMYHQAQFF